MNRRIALPRAAALAGVTFAIMLASHALAATVERWQDQIGPSHVHLRAVLETVVDVASGEDAMRRAIQAANASFTLDELTTVVRIASSCCKASQPLSRELTQLLRESHPIYAGRLPTDVNQFRGFLLASLGAFVPNAELYGYLKSELVFGGHALDVAAAAVAARSFAERADELIPLMEPYLGSTFDDAWVDLTTPELNYPQVDPTRARHEIIRTLIAFGPRAHRSLPRLDAIVRCPNCGTYASDTALPRKATEAADLIREVAAPGDHSVVTAAAVVPPLQLIDKRQRKTLAVKSLKLIDHDGEPLDFADLKGRPFVLTFFYSQCPNQLKCALTVQRLGALASQCADSGLSGKVGIYGITYDPRFDSPSILKRYGSMYGMSFDRNVRLLKTTDRLSEDFRDELALRVSYGAGSVNQHGIQLFVFDRQGRLAAMHDNELWQPKDVKNVLARLTAE